MLLESVLFGQGMVKGLKHFLDTELPGLYRSIKNMIKMNLTGGNAQAGMLAT